MSTGPLPTFSPQDTIYALSSGAPPTGIAIIRVSGSLASRVAFQIAGSPPLSPRRLSLRTFKASDGSAIDQGLAVFFAAPDSATGEDCVEFHCHGGKAVVAGMLGEIGKFAGTRLAEAGEFTRRALSNGRLDLVQTEALADLIEAETAGQRRLAMQGMLGGPSRLYETWADRLAEARAMLEAELDFSDEGDVPESLRDRVQPVLLTLIREMKDHLSGISASEIVRDGFRVVIMGPPNAGKSSLINALAKRDVAIVSDEAGTTRDLVEVSLDIGGQKIMVTDTAGIRQDAGRVEALGIERAFDAGRKANLVLWLVPADAAIVASDIPEGADLILSKVDLSRDGARAVDVELAISIVTGAGIEGLLRHIGAKASLASKDGGAMPLRLRHGALVQECLHQVEGGMKGPDMPELQAEHLRLASHALGRITGAVDVEDLLDRIFSSFCIGK